MTVLFRNFSALMFALLFSGALVSAQDLQPKKTGLPGRTVWALATSGTSSVTTFAASDKGLWRSTDNGTSWTETSLKNIAVYAVKSRDIGRTSTLLVGTDKGVLRSTDGGNTWASPEVTTGTVSTSNIVALKKVFDIEIVGTGTAWFAATEKGVYRSNNDGRSWSLVNIDRTADNNEVRGITVDGNTVIVNLWKEGLWRSTNNGNTWTKLTIAGETSLAKSVFAHTGRIWVQQGNKTTTATVSMLFVGAVSGNVWRSTDNGSSWTKSLAAGTALRSALSAPTGVDVLTSAGTALISGTPTGLAVSNDNGTTWQSFRTSLPQPISLASDSKNLYVGVQQSSAAAVAEKGASSLNDAAPGVGTFTTSAAGQSSCAIPSVNSFTPPSVIAGGSAMSVTINGTNFESGTQYRIVVINEITGNQLYLQTLTSGQTIGGIGVTYNNSNSSTLSLSSTILATASRIGITPYAPSGCGTQAGPGYTFYIDLRIPTVSSIAPTTFLRGSPNSPSATIYGTNFEPGSKVYLYHPSLPGGKFELGTTFVDANTLQTTWSIGIFYYIGAASSVEVGVENPSGGVSPTRQTLSIVNPAPVAGGLSIVQTTVGASSPLVIGGLGYYDGSQVYFEGQLKPSTFSNGNLTINLVGSDIPTARTYSVVVVNPAPGGGTTQPMTFNVLNYTPSITAFTPTELALGQDATLTLSGGGSFASGAVATLYPSGTELTTTFVNTNTLTVNVPGSLLATVSETNYSIRVRNPAPGGGLSAPVTIPVRNAAPTFSGVSPSTLVAAAQDTPLTLTGGNFLTGASVLISGPGIGLNTPLTTTVVNANTITATLPAGIAGVVGQYSLIVRNPNAVADSPAQNINVVYPQAQLSSVSPSTITVGASALTLTLDGSNFIAGASVLWDGALLTPASLTANRITVNLSAAQLAFSAAHTILVRNPQPNLGESGTLFVAVRNPAPVLTSLTPTLLLTNLAAPPTITLTGSGFGAESRVLLRPLHTSGTVLIIQPTLNSGTQVSFPLPLNLISASARYSLRVQNPALPNNVPAGSPFGGQGGGTSDSLLLSAQNPVPTFTAITPAALLAGNGTSTFTLTGTNFLSDVRVLINGTTTASQNVVIQDPTTLRLTLPASALALATTLNVQVTLPAPGGGTTAARTITLSNAAPVLDSIAPVSIQALRDTVITAYGSGFNLASQFRLVRGTTTVTLAIVQLPASTLALVRVPAAAIMTIATYQVRVFNGTPGGGTSLVRNLVVQAGQPVACEFVSVSQTPVVSANTLPAFTIRFRDALGNLTDAPVPFVNFSLTDGTSASVSSSGSISLTRSSLGVSTASVMRFYKAGTYSLWVSGFTTTTGTRTFTVAPGADSRVTLSGVPTNINAGTVLPGFTFRLEDAAGNLTDNGIGRLTYTRAGGSSTATLSITRLSTGIYSVQSTVCTIAGVYTFALSSVTPVNTLGTKTFTVVSGAAVQAAFTGVTLSMNAGTQQSAFDVRFADVYGNYTDLAVPTSVLYTNTTDATIRVSTGTITFAGRIGIGLYDAARVALTTAGNYTLAVNGFVNTGHRFFAVKPLAVTKVEFSDVPDTLWTAQPLPPVLVRFRDLYGNLTNDSRPVTFTKTGSPASTGTVALNPLGTGVYTTAGTVFWRSGNYTLSVSGIATANSLGKSTFFVKPDTARALILSAIMPQSLSVGDSAVHNWTLTLTGDNFNAASRVYGKNNNVLFPTTFVDETTLTVVVPPALRQLGAMMLEVRSTAPPNTSNMIPMFVFDPSLEYHATLETIASQQPILTAQEQTALTDLQQSGQYVSVRAIKLEVRPVDILTTRELTFTVAPGIVATAELGYPQQVGENDYYVRGSVAGDTTGKEFAVTMVDNRYIGTSFRVGGKDYTIQPLGNNGVHFLAEVNPVVANIEEACGSGIPDKPNYKNAPTLQSPPTACDQRTIRILLLLTPESSGAVQADGTYANMALQKVRADEKLQDANVALRRSLGWVYDDSKIVTLEYATAYPIPWDYNSGTQKFSNELAFVNHMHAAYSPNDNNNYEKIYANASVLRENPIINTLREQYAADVVAIIHRVVATYPSDNPKKATVTQIPGIDIAGLTANRNNAFILFGSSYFSSEYLLFGHEIGHLLGCRHSNEATQANAGQGHGYVFSHPNRIAPFSSITAGDANSVSFPFYSSPVLQYPGTFLATEKERPSIQNFLGVELNNYSAKELATNNPPVLGLFPAWLPFIPAGTADRHNETAVIDRYATEVAAYRSSPAKITVENMPQTLLRGDSKRVKVTFTNCNPNGFRYGILVLHQGQSSQQQIEIGIQVIADKTFSGNIATEEFDIAIPANTSGFVKKSVIIRLEPIGAPSSARQTAYYSVFCQNCNPPLASKRLVQLTQATENARPQYTQNNDEPQLLTLLQNTPNPVSSNKTDISFTLAESGFASIILYNTLGQEIKRLVQESLPKGMHTISIDVATLPNGIYTYRLQSGNKSIAKRMVIVR